MSGKTKAARRRKLCKRCEAQPVFCKDRCERCYRYLAKHGVERPWKLIVEAHERRLERAIFRAA